MIQSVMIKPVGDLCDLRCSYCYYRGQSPEGGGGLALSLERVERMLGRWLGSGGGQMSLSFQGGEPTLAGREWFEGFFASMDRHRRADQRISFALQSNGLQFDQAWVELLKSRDVLVGLSIDGPSELHDCYRRDGQGNGTFERVRRAGELLLSEGVQVNAMVLLNDRNVSEGKLLYDFFKAQGFKWLQFIPCVEWDSRGELRGFCVTGESYGDFLVDLFEAWYGQDVGKMFVRYFESLLLKLAGAGGGVCYNERYCDPGLTVEHDGSVYGCDHFVSEQWRLGSVDDPQWVHWDTHPRYMEFGRAKAKLARGCQACEYVGVCAGGCVKHRDRTSGVNVLCPGYKRFFKASLKRLEILAKRFGQGVNPGMSNRPG